MLDKGADNLKLMVFFHHRGKIFSWTKGQKKFSFVSETSSTKVHMLNNHEFVFENA